MVDADEAGEWATDAGELPHEQTDAFGALLRAEYEGERSWEIVERDDGWFGPGGEPSAYFSVYDDWPTRERLAMAVVEGRALDVGCGAGRHALYLQEQGHDVTGIDRSPGAIEVCEERGVEDVRQVDVADVADHFEPDTFDTVLMLGNNFGVVGTADTAPDVLSALGRVATDDATLVAESRDPVATDDQAHLDYHEYNRDRGRLPGALRIRVRYGRYATDWFDYLLAAPDRMADLAEPAGWAFEEALGIEGEGGDYVGILQREG